MIDIQMVKITWSRRNKKHLESNGYVFTNYDDEIIIDPNDLSVGSHVSVSFTCDYCKGEKQITEDAKLKPYKALLKERKKGGKDCCKNCKSQKLTENKIKRRIETKNTLGDKFPELVTEWSVINRNNPFYYSVSSKSKVWWVCKKGHTWSATINDRTSRGSGCPYCSNKIVAEDNSLAKLRPDLAVEWNYERNNGIAPTDVTTGTTTVIWWMCKHGHEWSARVYKRTNGQGCPYCAGRKVSMDNCLYTFSPEISEEWDFSKNSGVTPFDVTKSSNKKVWWKCAKCSHEWRTTINSRTGTMSTGCPQCNESKGEAKIRRILTNHETNFTTQYEIEGLVGMNGGLLRFDFGVFDNKGNLKFLIEFDGEFHYRKMYQNDKHELIVAHDKIKNSYCDQNNIPLIRIPYWEFGNIESILIEQFIRYNLSTPD